MRSHPIVAACFVFTLVAACADDVDSQSDPQTTDAEAEDWEPEYADGVLQPLPGGFPDHEITLVNVDEAGSRDGIFARTLDQVLADISPVDIIVSDEPATQGGTMPVVAGMDTRDGGLDGYFPVIVSIGGAAQDFHIEPLEDELGITLDDVNFFIAMEVHAYALAQRADAPWEPSFEAFVEYAQAHPGELRYISPGVGAGQDIFMEWIMSELDVEVTKIPAADHESAMAAVGAGEGDFTMNRPELAGPAQEQGRVDIIMVTTQDVPEVWADNPGLISAKDFAAHGLPDEATWGSVLGFAAPAEVPDLHIQWLTELFTAATETDTYQERPDTLTGMQIQLLDAEEANSVAHRVYEFTEPIVRAVGLHHEDN